MIFDVMHILLGVLIFSVLFSLLDNSMMSQIITLKPQTLLKFLDSFFILNCYHIA